MTDTLRDRIAAAIAAHEPVTDYSGADGECIECDLNPRWPDSEAPTGPTAGWKRHATHLADAILAIPGIAVVELPEPAGAVRCWPALVGGEPESIYRAGDEVVVSGGLRLYVDEARDLAAALLAAADYAEREQ